MKTTQTNEIQSPRIPKLPNSDAPRKIENGADHSMKSWLNADFSLQRSSGALLEQIRLKHATLNGMELNKTRLTDISIEVSDLSGIVWTNIHLQRAEMKQCRLIGAHLIESHVEDALFRDDNFENSFFISVELKHAHFQDCNLQHAIFENTDLSGVIFERCNLTGAGLRGVKLIGTDFRGSIINGMQVDAKDIKGAIIESSQAVQVVNLLGLNVKEPGE